MSGYRGIRTTRAILPNTGLFPFSHGQSPHSCCHKVGAIALLDLRNPTRPLVGKEAWTNWTMFLNNHKPITVLLDIDPAYLSQPLYDFDLLQERYPYSPMVAEAEKCYPHPIPIDAIRRSILVCAKWYTFFKIISGREITDTDFSRAERSFESKLQKTGRKQPSFWSEFLDDTLLPMRLNPPKD
jgi:hypothetical protein